MSTIGDNIRSARKKAGLSQAELANLAGITKAAISRYESGLRTPRPEHLASIATYLVVSIEELMGISLNTLTPQEIRQQMSLEDYLKTLGYDLFVDYPEDSKTWLCVDNSNKKLYLVQPEDILQLINSIQDYAKFQLNGLINKGTEIPDTDGWFKDKT